MNTNLMSENNDTDKNFQTAGNDHKPEEIEGEKGADEEGTLLNEEEEKGMDMGTTFKEDKEQDLDDLIHSQATLKKNDFPNPDEI